MKRTRFTETQIVKALKEQENGRNAVMIRPPESARTGIWVVGG
jgi:hypothetical protein